MRRANRPEGEHRSLILRVADALGLSRTPDALADDSQTSSVSDVRDLPKVAPHSTLALMVQMDPVVASTYAEAVIRDINNCISSFCVDQKKTSVETVLEQVHSLKNITAAIGSDQLISACEAMRLDVCRGTALDTIEARYRAVGTAAVQAVVGYVRLTVPTLIEGNEDPNGRY